MGRDGLIAVAFTGHKSLHGLRHGGRPPAVAGRREIEPLKVGGSGRKATTGAIPRVLPERLEAVR